MSKYIEPKEAGLFDKMERLEELGDMGDPLARLDEVIDWDAFLPLLEELVPCESKGPGGRPRFHPLAMFKVLVIQSLYGLSDNQVEFQVTDRMSFKRFLGMSDADKAPDEKTVWLFRQSLVESGLERKLFDCFGRKLESQGMIARKGQMVDASFVEVPRQRNTRAENKEIADGGEPAEWKKEPSKRRQKDIQARWTVKNGRRFYGYKNHVKVDSRSKLITAFEVTPANVHDSRMLPRLLGKGDPVTYADSAYTGKPSEDLCKELEIEFKPIERAYRNKPLNKRQEKSNKARSRTRCRVEHVFGTMIMCMRRQWNRCIGSARNAAAIAMTNLVYNMVRFEQIERLGLRNWRAA